jgi:hypothetical protein
MKRVWIIAAVVAALLVLPGLAAADSTLFYSGDFNGVNGLSNEYNTIVSQSNVYDNFIITGSSSWTVSGLFTNNLITSLSNFGGTAEWEIRSGLSNGFGGTLIASGISADTLTLNGQDGFGLFGAYAQVTGLNVTLAPGQYWISVAPIGNGTGGRSFESTTSFLNCIDCGAHTGDDAFWNSSFFGQNFTQCTGGACGVGPPADFSFGVIGHVNTTQTPEPASLLLLGSGLLGLAGGIRRRMKA